MTTNKRNSKHWKWFFFVSGYAFMFGFPFLFFPNVVIPRLGFNVTDEPWVRLFGMILLGLSFLAIQIYRSGSVEILWASTMVRLWIAIVLFSLVMVGHPKFLLVPALLNLIGVLGTGKAYQEERRLQTQTRMTLL